VEEFLTEAFSHVNLDWHDYVELDPKYLRPAEVDLLIGDASKAKSELGWSPKVTFKELVRLMVDADVSTANRSEHEIFGDTDSAQSSTSVGS
jgi:GDPmannose 4,6-dehydratase